MSYFTQVSYSDTGSLDAFTRLRVSQPEQLFSVQCQYNKATIQMESGNTGTGVAPAHDANTRMVALSATAGSGTSFMQSYKYIAYQPGKSQLIAMTGVLGTAVANVTKDYGYFDDKNGVIYRQNGTSGLQLGVRTSTSGSTVDTFVNQASWNLDKMDGTGISRVNLDVTKSFILVIDLQFLGMGRVRVGFDVDGVIYYVHQFLNTNALAVPYMQSATLPIQALLTATASGSTATCHFKCASVNSEGGSPNFLGYQIATPEATVTAASGARTHLISIRPKTTFNGIINREDFLMDIVNLVITGTNPVFWELCVGATFSVAPTYADVNATYSGFEYGTGGTYSGLSGIIVASGYAQASNQIKEAIHRAVSSHYPISLNRAGAVHAMGTLSLLVTGIGGTSATRGNIEFYETR